MVWSNWHTYTGQNSTVGPRDCTIGCPSLAETLNWSSRFIGLSCSVQVMECSRCRWNAEDRRWFILDVRRCPHYLCSCFSQLVLACFLVYCCQKIPQKISFWFNRLFIIGFSSLISPTNEDSQCLRDASYRVRQLGLF